MNRPNNPTLASSPPALSTPVTPAMVNMASNSTVPHTQFTLPIPNSPLNASNSAEHSAHSTSIRERESIQSPVTEENILPSPVEVDRKRTVNPSNPDSPSMLRNSEDFRSCMREVMQPMIDDLKVYVHNEILNIKETMVNQITTQEAIIDQQQQCIEMLEQLLQERK